MGATPSVPAAITTASEYAPATHDPSIVEPVAGQVIAELDRDAIPSPTVVVIAVVGESTGNEVSVAPTSSTAPAAVTPNILTYAGFVGLVLLLSALALAVYRRRIETRQMEQQ